MIYKMIINAAFLAIGYYIGKEVGRTEQAQKVARRPRDNETGASEKAAVSDSVNKSVS